MLKARSILAIFPLSIMVLWLYWGFSGMGQLFWSDVPTENSTQAGSPFFLGGIQMNEGDQENWIKQLKLSGMNTVEVTVYAHQGRWFDNNLWYAEEEPGIIQEIKLAKEAGLKVALILRLQLDHAFDENKFLWHGMVFPDGDYFTNRWFEGYTRFAKKWAILAEKHGVDILVLGSEMNALFASSDCLEVPTLEEYYLNEDKQTRYRQKMLQFEEELGPELLYTDGAPNYTDLNAYLDDQIARKKKWAQICTYTDSVDNLHAIRVRRSVHNWYWDRLIYKVRQVYNGKLTIAANFDNFQHIRFWDKLDYIGINAYFPLRTLGNPLDDSTQFRQNWSLILDSILSYRVHAKVPHHPILFTELGYADHSGSTLHPWQGSGFSVLDVNGRDSLFIWKNQPKKPFERNSAVRALLETVKEKNFPLAGILYWKLTSHPEQVKHDPFSLHIGPASKDTLQDLLLKFKTMKKDLLTEQVWDRWVDTPAGTP